MAKIPSYPFNSKFCSKVGHRPEYFFPACIEAAYAPICDIRATSRGESADGHFVIPRAVAIFRLPKPFFLRSFMRLRSLLCLAVSAVSFAACNEDDNGVAPQYRQRVFNYAFNEGQLQGRSQYQGKRPRNLLATLTVDEMPPDSVRLTVALKNSQSGSQYIVGAYDAIDSTDTANRRYFFNPLPNTKIYWQTIPGNDSMIVSRTQLARYKYDSLLNYYNGYFIVRDVAGSANTADSIDAQSQLILGTFAR